MNEELIDYAGYDAIDTILKPINGSFIIFFHPNDHLPIHKKLADEYRKQYNNRLTQMVNNGIKLLQSLNNTKLFGEKELHSLFQL